MRHNVPGLTLGLAALSLISLGCNTSSTPGPNSFTTVYDTVLAPTCTNDYCHYNFIGIRYSALDMSSKVYAYWSLVDQPCIGPSCSEMGVRVVPGQPDISMLYLKVSQDMPPCGARMPADPDTLLINNTSQFSGTPLTDAQQQLIHDWIADGAPND